MPVLFFVWCLLALVVLSMAGYRKLVARRDDELVHLGDGDATLINAQSDVAERLTWIDKWGQILTLLTVLFGLILGSVFLYQGWIASAQKIHI